MGSERSGLPSSAPTQDTEVTEEAIKDQLAKLFASAEFARRPVLRHFLAFVVEKVLAGQAHEVKEYTVAIEVFGRKENFDASKDSIVRIQAGRLRRALERYYASCSLHDPVKIVIPKGSYVPTFHELSGSGLDKGNFWSEWGGARPAESFGPTVAVLPLVNMTNDAGQEYFADGLTEELTHELARFQGLSVVASYSTMQLKNERAGAREMAQRLGVRFLLEGGVRRDVSLIKISVRLIDTATEQLLSAYTAIINSECPAHDARLPAQGKITAWLRTQNVSGSKVWAKVLRLAQSIRGPGSRGRETVGGLRRLGPRQAGRVLAQAVSGGCSR